MSLLHDFADQKKIGSEFTDFASYLGIKGCDSPAQEDIEQLYPKWLLSKKRGQFNRILHDRRKRTNRSMLTTHESLPLHGQPTGGFKDYPDCRSGFSVLCGRPDCKYCSQVIRNQITRCYENLLAVIEVARDGKVLPESAQAIVNHFDSDKNVHARGISQSRIMEKASELRK